MFRKRHLTLGSKRPPFPDSIKLSVRHANVFDINDIMEYVLKLKPQSPICRIIEPLIGQADLGEFKALCLKSIKLQRLVLVVENREGLKGIIFGSIDSTIWGSNARILEEIAFIADSKRAAFLLLKEYIKIAKELKANGEIHMFSMGELPTTNLDYSKFGLELIEKSWAG
jgi:hypothetical protein